MRQSLHSPKPVNARPERSWSDNFPSASQATDPAKSLAFSMTNIPVQSGAGVIQQKSKVTNKGQDFKWGGKTTVVGKEMEAWLDPKEPVQGEEANINTKQDPMMQAIRNKYKATLTSGCLLVKGHLLNANLGGKALNNNLFPITKTANAEHLRTAENVVKNKIWKDRTPTYYKVGIDGSPSIDTTDHTMKISWGDWDGKASGVISNMKNVSVPSKFNDIKTNGGAKKEKARMTNKKSSSNNFSISPYENIGGMDDISKENRKYESANNIYKTTHTANAGKQDFMIDDVDEQPKKKIKTK